MTRGGPESGRPFILTSDVVKVVKVILVKIIKTAPYMLVA